MMTVDGAFRFHGGTICPPAIGLNGWYMKRSVQKDTELSDYTQAEFLNFLFYFILSKSQILKFGDFTNTPEPLGKSVIAMFYIRCCEQYFPFYFLIL